MSDAADAAKRLHGIVLQFIATMQEPQRAVGLTTGQIQSTAVSAYPDVALSVFIDVVNASMA